MLPKSKVIHNPHQAHIWDCSGIIIDSACFGGAGGHTDFGKNLKGESQISPVQTLFSAILIIRNDNNDLLKNT